MHGGQNPLLITNLRGQEWRMTNNEVEFHYNLQMLIKSFFDFVVVVSLKRCFVVIVWANYWLNSCHEVTNYLRLFCFHSNWGSTKRHHHWGGTTYVLLTFIHPASRSRVGSHNAIVLVYNKYKSHCWRDNNPCPRHQLGTATEVSRCQSQYNVSSIITTCSSIISKAN